MGGQTTARAKIGLAGTRWSLQDIDLHSSTAQKSSLLRSTSLSLGGRTPRCSKSHMMRFAAAQSPSPKA